MTESLWLDHKEGWEPKNWCFQTVVLKKTLESPLDSKEIAPVYPKGDQPWIFIGKTDGEAEAPILWPPDAKSQLIQKDPHGVAKSWTWLSNWTTTLPELRSYHLIPHSFCFTCPGLGAGPLPRRVARPPPFTQVSAQTSADPRELLDPLGIKLHIPHQFNPPPTLIHLSLSPQDKSFFYLSGIQIQLCKSRGLTLLCGSVLGQCPAHWMDGCLNGWMEGWMDGQMDRWMDGWVSEWMSKRGTSNSELKQTIVSKVMCPEGRWWDSEWVFSYMLRTLSPSKHNEGSTMRAMEIAWVLE